MAEVTVIPLIREVTVPLQGTVVIFGRASAGPLATLVPVRYESDIAVFGSGELVDALRLALSASRLGVFAYRLDLPLDQFDTLATFEALELAYDAALEVEPGIFCPVCVVYDGYTFAEQLARVCAEQAAYGRGLLGVLAAPGAFLEDFSETLTLDPSFPVRLAHIPADGLTVVAGETELSPGVDYVLEPPDYLYSLKAEPETVTISYQYYDLASQVGYLESLPRLDPNLGRFLVVVAQETACFGYLTSLSPYIATLIGETDADELGGGQSITGGNFLPYLYPDDLRLRLRDIGFVTLKPAVGRGMVLDILQTQGDGVYRSLVVSRTCIDIGRILSKSFAPLIGDPIENRILNSVGQNALRTLMDTGAIVDPRIQVASQRLTGMAEAKIVTVDVQIPGIIERIQTRMQIGV